MSAEKTGVLNDLGMHIKARRPEAVLDMDIQNDELVLRTTRTLLIDLIRFLRDDVSCACNQLMGICGVDYPERSKRFDVVYFLLSLKHNRRIRVVLETDEEMPVPSLCEIYSAAGWFEREVWDMYGVFFSDHPDLRRILSDYGFDGYPLRKDFPLTGYVEVRYDEEQKRVVYEPVSLAQEYRNFDFLSPWEGQGALPGDEKADDQQGTV